MTTELMKSSPFEITTFDQLERFANMLAKSDFAPKDYKGKPENVVIAVQMGYELNLKPMQAIQNIAVVNGRPMVWGDAALALVRGHSECAGVSERMEGSIKGGDAVAYCEVKRGKEIISSSFTIQQAAQAGLIGKPGTWTQYPERMLQLRARGFALRDSFPDVLKGIHIEGELDSIEEAQFEEVKKTNESKLGTQAVKNAVTKTVNAMRNHVETEADVATVNIEDNEKRQREIWCDKIQEMLLNLYPSRGTEDNKAKADYIEKIFNTRNWTKVESMSSEQIKAGYHKLKNELEFTPLANGKLNHDAMHIS